MLNKKLFGKLNIIDLIIIAVVIIMLIAGALFLTKKDETASTQTLVMKYYIEEVSDFVIDDVVEGASLLDAEKSVDLGFVTDVDIRDSYTAIESPSQVTAGTKEGYKSAIITGEVAGQKNALGAIIGGQQYGVGHSFTLRAGNAKMYLRVYDISIKDENTAKNQEAPFVLSFEHNEVNALVAESIKEGDEVYDHSGRVVLGTVGAIEISPAKVYTQNSAGRIVTSPKDGYVTVKLMVNSSGTINENGSAKIASKEYFLGKKITLSAGNALMSGAMLINIE